MESGPGVWSLAPSREAVAGEAGGERWASREGSEGARLAEVDAATASSAPRSKATQERLMVPVRDCAFQPGRGSACVRRSCGTALVERCTSAGAVCATSESGGYQRQRATAAAGQLSTPLSVERAGLIHGGRARNAAAAGRAP